MFGFIRFSPSMSRNDELNALNQNFNQIESDSESNSGTPSNGGAIGDIIMTMKTAPTSNRLFMDGSTYKKDDYPALWALNTTHPAYFASTTSTTFTLVDMSQRMPLGKAHSGTGTTLGQIGGEIDHQHYTGQGFDGSDFYGYGDNSGNPIYGSRVTTANTRVLSGASAAASQSVREAFTDKRNPPFAVVNFEVVAKLS